MKYCNRTVDEYTRKILQVSFPEILILTNAERSGSVARASDWGSKVYWFYMY